MAREESLDYEHSTSTTPLVYVTFVRLRAKEKTVTVFSPASRCFLCRAGARPTAFSFSPLSSEPISRGVAHRYPTGGDKVSRNGSAILGKDRGRFTRKLERKREIKSERERKNVSDERTITRGGEKGVTSKVN